VIVCCETNNASLKIIRKHIFTFEENRCNFNNCTLIRLVPHFLIQECGNTVHNAEPVTKTKWVEPHLAMIGLVSVQILV